MNKIYNSYAHFAVLCAHEDLYPSEELKLFIIGWTTQSSFVTVYILVMLVSLLKTEAIKQQYKIICPTLIYYFYY